MPDTKKVYVPPAMPEICAILDSPRTPRYALYVQPSHESPFTVTAPPPCLLELSPTRYTICLGRTFVCRCRSTALSTPNSCSPLGLICVAETFQNFTAWCNIKMPSFYDYSADATAAVAAAADAAAPGAVGAILLNFNGIFSSANCRMH